MIYSSVYLLLGLLVGLLLVDYSYSCVGSGVCGGGGGGGCFSPPPVSCGGGCSTGYSCGHYGCAKNRVARAHSANTISIDDQNSHINDLPLQHRFLQGPRNPNAMFRECCEARNLPDACIAKCNFNVYTKESLMSMYFKTDACPIEAAAELQYCAAQGRDHRACCLRNGVHTTLAGEKCLTFCDQRPGNVTQLDFSYASCYDRFEQMKGCFWHSALVQ